MILGIEPEDIKKIIHHTKIEKLIHNPPGRINLSSADIITAPWDISKWLSLGSGNWRMTEYLFAKAIDTEIKFVSQEDIVSDFYIEKMNDPDLHKFTSHANFNYTTKDALDFQAKIENKEIIAMGIYSDKKFQGICCLQEINWINRTAEIVFLIFEQGQGLGHQLGVQMIKHAFNELNLNKVWIGCADENIAMRKLANKLDMEYEGILRNHIWLNGEYVDVYRFCYLKK